MTYINQDYIITTIMDCKQTFFNEKYITYEELNIVKDLIQKRFNEENIGALITDEINSNCFDMKEVILLKKDWNQVRNNFGYFPNIEIARILLDKSFILNSLINLHKNNLSKVEEQIKSSKIKEKNLLLFYKEKLKNINDLAINQDYWEEDRNFYSNIRAYYKFLTEDLYSLIFNTISSLQNQITNPMLKWQCETSKQEELRNKMFLYFIEKNNLCKKKDVYITLNGKIITNIYLPSYDDLLNSYYLEIEKLEYLYYPEELGISR